MRVMRQRRAPGVKDQRRTDASAQMLGIGGDGLQHFGGHIEQKPIHRRPCKRPGTRVFPSESG